MDYKLPGLEYGYADLEPHISEEQLKVHHQKHHKAYVDGANKVLEELKKARNDSAEIDAKEVAKSLSWYLGGHTLHSLFWKNLSPKKTEPRGRIMTKIQEEFGSYKDFQKEFEALAKSVEGSGWATLIYCPMTKRISLMQIEKHNTNIIPNHPIILVLDMFEHAYYIDHKNEKAKYIRSFWDLVNWEVVNNRLEKR